MTFVAHAGIDALCCWGSLEVQRSMLFVTKFILAYFMDFVGSQQQQMHALSACCPPALVFLQGQHGCILTPTPKCIARAYAFLQVILLSPGGGLLEGLTTNFFVVMHPASCPGNSAPSNMAHTPKQALGQCSSNQAAAISIPGSERHIDKPLESFEAPEGLVVMTAGSQDGVLPGIMRRRVLEFCREMGVPVIEQPPNIRDRHLWREAFVANCIRGVQAVGKLTLPAPTAQSPADAGLPEGGAASIVVDFPVGHVTQRLRQRLHSWLSEVTAGGGDGWLAAPHDTAEPP